MIVSDRPYCLNQIIMQENERNTQTSKEEILKPSRRDFLALGIVTVGTAVVLTAVPKPLVNPIRWDRKLPTALPIPFRRFILTRRTTLSGEQSVENIAYGTQFPNNRCLLQIVGESELQEYPTIADVEDEYVNYITKLIWLDI